MDALTILGGGQVTGDSFVEGSSVRLTASVMDFDNQPIDPALIRLLILKPGETTSQIATTTTDGNNCVGVIPLIKAGLWKFRFETTTGTMAAVEGTIMATPRQVPALMSTP